MQEMAMLSQAHKCFTLSFFHSSYCTRARLRSWRKELGFATPHQHSIGLRRTCVRLHVTGYSKSTLKLGSEPSFAKVYKTLGLKGRNPILGGVPPTASEGKRTWGEVAQNDQQQRMLQVVLVSPQIPGNTGCIARTCAATCVGLHLVEPMGFKIEDSKLKRAGLDYWPYVVVKVHKSWNDFFTYFQEQEGEKRLLAFTKKGREVHTDVNYKSGDWLLFGSEVDGLPAAALEQCSSGEYAGGTVRLPMNETYVRSLNLSVSAGIGVYEALRQLDSHTNYRTLDVQASSPPLEAVLSGHNDGYP